MKAPGFTRKIVAGVAVAPDTVTVVPLMDRNRSRSRTGGARPDSHDADPEDAIVVTSDVGAGNDPARLLRAALERMRERFPDARFRLYLSLLPGLADCRVLPLPPMRQADLALVIRRGAARYFPGANESRLTGVWRVEPGARFASDLLAMWRSRRNRTGPAPILAGITHATTLDALLGAASDAGARVVAVAPALAAWAVHGIAEAGSPPPADWSDEVSDVTRPGPSLRTPEHQPERAMLIVHSGGLLHLVVLNRGTVTLIRRYRDGGLDRLASDLDTLLGAGKEIETRDPACATRIAVIAAPGMRAALRARIEREDRVIADAGGDPAAIAARCVPFVRGSGFVPDAVDAEARQWRRRTARRLAAAAIVLLIVAGGIELGGVKRELANVRRLRAELRSRVESATVIRDSFEQARERLGALDQAIHGSPHFTELLLDIAMRLPPEAHIVDLAATADTIRLNGIAFRSAEALEALRGAPSLRELGMVGPIRRELRGDSAAIERFTLAGPLAARPFGIIQTESPPVRGGGSR